MSAKSIKVMVCSGPQICAPGVFTGRGTEIGIVVQAAEKQVVSLRVDDEERSIEIEMGRILPVIVSQRGLTAMPAIGRLVEVAPRVVKAVRGTYEALFFFLR